MDTFWGSTLSLLLYNFDSKTHLLLFTTIIFGLNSFTSNPFILNLVVFVLSNSNTSVHLVSSILSGFSLKNRFKNSFKPGELILLSHLTSKLVIYCHQNRFRGWASFFLLTNIFPLISQLVPAYLPAVVTWIVLSAAITLNREDLLNLTLEILEEKRLLFYWPSLLTVIIFLPVLFPKLFQNQNSLRKFYHFASVALFLPAAFWCSNVLKIAMAVALTLFIHLETVRNDFKFKRFLVFGNFMEKCRNELDSGEMVLSHVYLLLGCALPFWLNESLEISSFAGVISLGIGDSLASIGGKCFGKTTWHSKTRKTLEGSICGSMGMFSAWIVLNELCRAQISIPKLLFISVASATWEALIDLNDNLTLPLFTHFIIKQM